MNLEDFYSDYGNIPQFLKDQAQDLLKVDFKKLPVNIL